MDAVSVPKVFIKRLKDLRLQDYKINNPDKHVYPHFIYAETLESTELDDSADAYGVANGDANEFVSRQSYF